MTYSTMTLVELLDRFASNDPAPGGGSASAVAGALGVSLLLMVATLPKTRTGAPEEAAALAEASARLRPLRDRFVDLITRDSDAYSRVLAAYRLPKASDADKGARRLAIDAAMREATETPLETLRLAQQALRAGVVVLRNGLPSAASDGGVAVELLLATARGAGLNVATNLAAIKDDAYVSQTAAERLRLEIDATADGEQARAALA